MALQTTAKQLAELLEQVSHDLAKAMNGNSAAAQRVRTGTIKLGKIAKTFRKESVQVGKSPKKAKKAKKAKKTVAKRKTAKKAAPKRKAAKKTARKATKKTASKATKKRTVRKAAKRRTTRRR